MQKLQSLYAPLSITHPSPPFHPNSLEKTPAPLRVPKLRVNPRFNGAFHNRHDNYHDIFTTSVTLPSIRIRLNTLTLPFLYWYLILLLNDLTSRNTQQGYERKGHLFLYLVHNSRSVALLKSAQALSLRGDLFDPIRRKLKADKDRVAIWTKCMQSVTDDVPITFGQSEMKKIVASELGITAGQVDEVFQFVDGEVIGASIGQVYKARVKPGPVLRGPVGQRAYDEWVGSMVALKVQRPKVDRSIGMDVFLITEAAYWMEESRAGDVRGIAEGFREGLFGELDYRMEARNANSFREVYGELDTIFIPSACEERSTGRVCAMEWVRGGVRRSRGTRGWTWSWWASGAA